MKHTQECQLKKCIFLTEEEYNNIIHILLGDEKIRVELGCENEFSIYGIDHGYYFSIIKEKLQSYFDVKILSIHIEGFECPCMWIVYED